MPVKIETLGVTTKLPCTIKEDEVYIQTVKTTGNGCHVGVPIKYAHWKVLVIPYEPPKEGK